MRLWYLMLSPPGELSYEIENINTSKNLIINATELILRNSFIPSLVHKRETRLYVWRYWKIRLWHTPKKKRELALYGAQLGHDEHGKQFL